MEKILKVGLILSLLVSCLGVGLADNVLNIPLHAATLSLNPTGVQDRSALWVSRQINCQLVRFKGGASELEAAKSIQYISTDKIEVILNNKSHFQDGSPVTAEDVAASFDFLRQSRQVLLNIFSWIKNIEVVNNQELIFTLSKPTPEFLKVLASPNYSIFKKSFIEKAEQDSSLWKYPMGCGGYYVTQNTPGYIFIKPNNPDDIPVKFFLIANNEINQSEVSNYSIIDMAVDGSPESLKGFQRIDIFDPSQIYIGINATKQPWQSLSARCSFLAHFDTQKVLQSYGNIAKLANDFIPSGILGYDPNATFIQNIRNKYSKVVPPKLNKVCIAYLTVAIPEQYRSAFVAALKEQFPNVQINTITNDQQFGITFARSNCDFFAFDLKSNYLDAYEFILLFSEKYINFSGIYDDQFAKQIEASQDIQDIQERVVDYRNIINKINNQCLILPVLTIPNERVFISNKLKTPGMGQGSINDYYLGHVRWINQ